MANADELCQFARLGQTSKIQKCLQKRSVDINALNLYGESALSTATYYNQILVVEYLLANKADPKLRLSAGHTAVHIACRFANIPILQLLLSIKKTEDNNEEEHQEKQDQHIYDCLRVQDNANLTPIHWAATQESVSKRQKIFAYLDRRMPGVLDSRYDPNWFNAWAVTHSWITEQKKPTKNVFSISPVAHTLSQLTNTDKFYQQYSEQASSLPLTDITPLDMTPRTSLNDYEHTQRQPPSVTMKKYYDDIHEKNKRRLPKVELPTKLPNLPPTPITSRIVSSINRVPRQEQKHNEHRELCCTQKSSSSVNNKMPVTAEKTPYSQRLNSIIKHSFSPLSDHSTYRAERAHVIPTFVYPPSSSIIEYKSNKSHDYEDMVTPISLGKRPSHNLLSNIVPSTTTPSSSDRSSRQSTKPSGSFGFDTSIDPRCHNDTTIETYEQQDVESLYEDEINHFDYICKSTSTLGISTPGAYDD